MAIIWIIERSREDQESIAAKLMGDFAVRVFASMESFQRLARFNRKMTPTALVVDAQSLTWPLERVTQTLDYLLPDILRVLVTSDPELRGQAATWRCLSRPLEGMMLSAYVNQSVHEQKSISLHTMVRYRDVVLDVSKAELRMALSPAALQLSRKESGILQLLMERPGACISREEIQDRVWDGVKVAPRNIDSHVSRLRKRLLDTELGIKSVYGGGYILR